MHAVHKKRLLALSAAAYFAAAYYFIPGLWKRHERRVDTQPNQLLTRTAQGIPGDPLNVGLVGSEIEIVQAMTAARWYPADRTTVRSSLKIATSVALRRPYPSAPVSPLYYDGRRQDLAFQLEVGHSASQRHHIRLWRTTDISGDGRDVWFGSVSFDRGVGLSRETGQITHHIDPDLDAERTYLMATLQQAGALASINQRPGIGATTTGRNGGGDAYFTDGQMTVGVLSPGYTAPTKTKK